MQQEFRREKYDNLNTDYKKLCELNTFLLNRKNKGRILEENFKMGTRKLCVKQGKIEHHFRIHIYATQTVHTTRLLRLYI
jgi:hypothetical protein